MSRHASVSCLGGLTAPSVGTTWGTCRGSLRRSNFGIPRRHDILSMLDAERIFIGGDLLCQCPCNLVNGCQTLHFGQTIPELMIRLITAAFYLGSFFR